MRYLVYLFPLLINFIAGGTFFISAYRLSKAGVNSVLVGGTLAAWAIPYAVCSLLVGKFTTEKNAAKLVISGALCIALDSLCFLIFDGLYLQFLWIALNGVCFSLYCTPFQVFSKSLETSDGKTDHLTGAVRSAALYTASWSLGMAIGPFIFGYLSYKTGFMLNTLFGVFIAICLYGINRSVRNKKSVSVENIPQKDEKSEVTPKIAFPDMALAGWLVGASVSISVTIARTMIPNRAVVLEFSKEDAGLTLFILGVVQALFSVSLYWSKKWMYKWQPLVLFGIFGIASCLLFGLGSTLCFFLIGAVAFGIFSGASYFSLVFHSLAHPTKSAQYVAVNEAVVGICNITAPTLAGFLVTATKVSGAGFLLAAAVVLILQLIVGIMLFRIRKAI